MMFLIFDGKKSAVIDFNNYSLYLCLSVNTVVFPSFLSSSTVVILSSFLASATFLRKIVDIFS